MTRLFIISLIFSSLFFPLAAQEKSPVAAVFRLDRLYTEGHNEPGLEQLLSMEESQPTFMSLISRLRRAVFDKNVKVCIFYGEGVGLGLAQVQELQRHILKLKDAGKKTYFYSRSLSINNLNVASAVDKIVLFPEGEVLFNGIQLQGVYFKKLMDKLHLKADIIHIGDYKSAGEPFYLNGPSKESAQQTQSLLDNVTDQLKASLNKHRDIKISTINELTSKALLSAKEAKAAGLVDELAYHKNFVDAVKKEHGENLKFSTTYGLPKQKKIKLNSIMDIFSLINELSAPPKVDDIDKISLTVIEGAIHSKMGNALRRHILLAAKDENVKAMVLRVNSPGGSALASEVICQALKEFKKAGKPLIVSMGNIAASGGYYVAAPGDAIYAEKLTITGSIGVVGGKIVMGDLMDEIGISFHNYKKGEHVDMLSTLRPFSDKERNILKASFNRVYGTFKKRVQEGRGAKLTKDIEQIAGGRVYTGNEALALGLVDKIGGLRDAISDAVGRSKLKRYKVSMFPKEMKVMDFLSKELREKGNEEYIYQDHKKSLASVFKTDLIKQQVNALKSLNPKLGKTLETFFINLQMLHEEKVILVSPTFNF